MLPESLPRRDRDRTKQKQRITHLTKEVLEALLVEGAREALLDRLLGERDVLLEDVVDREALSAHLAVCESGRGEKTLTSDGDAGSSD